MLNSLYRGEIMQINYVLTEQERMKKELSKGKQNYGTDKNNMA